MRKLIVAVLTLTACASQNTPMHAPSTGSTPSATAAVTNPCPAASAATLNATLWMQTSAEYQAIAREVYRSARTQLDLALADPAWNAMPDVTSSATKPPAVVLDLDETAIDTSSFQSRAIREQRSYTEESWKQFSEAGNSRAIAPAGDFLRYAASRGVAIFYVTNRVAAEEPPLRKNIGALNFPLSDSPDNVLTRNERPEWTSDKSSRRMYVASNYRVLLLLGDDLNDFMPAAGKSIADRNELLQRSEDQWGQRWFMLPNPMYGSWERAVTGTASGDCGVLQKKIESLRTDETYRP